MVNAASNNKAISVGHIGNIVELWERIVERNVNVDLGSDQTSLHNPYQGGYFPADYTYEESTTMMSNHPEKFKQEIQKTPKTCRCNKYIIIQGMFFWDYGNAFLLEASRVGADVLNEDGSFRYPSYVEDIMGPICFDYGFGPYRWVCTSGNPKDLAKTDEIARSVLQELAKQSKPAISQQLTDNIRIEQAGQNELVVGMD